MKPHVSTFLAYTRSLILSAAAALSIGSPAVAAPTVSAISGTAAHGGSISISGRDFGIRSGYNNINGSWRSGTFMNFRFKDFEDGKLNSQGLYPQSGGAPWSPTSNDLSVRAGGPANSAHFMRRSYSNGEGGGLSADASGSGNQLYTTFKFMIDANTQSGKFFRFYADSPQNNVYLSTGCSGTTVRGFSECTGSSCDPVTEWGTGPAFKSGMWHRVEVFADAAINLFTVWVDGVQAWSKRDWLATKLALNGHTLDYPNMIDGPDRGCGSSGAYSYDDIFIDFTQARIEISDSPTWAGARKKEVQIPVAWSATMIEAKVNAGTFSAGQNVFLYVVDPQGQANEQGYPVTLGGTVTSQRPNPPTLTVQ